MALDCVEPMVCCFFLLCDGGGGGNSPNVNSNDVSSPSKCAGTAFRNEAHT